MTASILGIGTAVPEFSIEQTDAAEQVSQLCGASAPQQPALKALYRRSGVLKRHSVLLKSSTNGKPAEQEFYRQGDNSQLGPTTAQRMKVYEVAAAPLAIEASLRALSDAEVKPEVITDLVTVSCSGFFAPGVDLALVVELGLRPTASRTHIGFMGCQGALNGLRVAKAFAESRGDARVLCCAVELCSLHHQFDGRPDQIVANALFADGAAAVVVGRASQPTTPWQLVDVRSTVIPDSLEYLSWQIKDHGFQMTLSPQLPALIDQALRISLEPWLREHDLGIEDIGSWAIHPGGSRIVESCARAVAADSQSVADSQQVLAEFGNMSSPTVLFILDRLRRRNAARPCVALAFGPGVAVEAALFR
jgi:predicted naringenin-chalcone synthase